MDNAVYVVFSSTPTKMGRLIRFATRNRYNHVSLSLSGDIRRMYSFARYRRTVPLWGGLVEESILRYASFAGQSRVKICRLPVEEATLAHLRNYLARLWNDREDYIYNTPGALASLFRLRPAIPKAHTCVSFVHEVLTRFRLADADPRACPSIHDLEVLLADYVVYEGSALPLTREGEWGQDHFPEAVSRSFAIRTTARHFGRLARRALTGAV